MHLFDPPRCQLHSALARPSFQRWWRMAFATLRNRLRLRTRWLQWRQRRNGPVPVPAYLGAPSRFTAGTWVRVLDADRIFATLSTRKTLRGLLWVWQQWAYCGTVHQVFKPVRRMMDDAGRMRAISGTVLLDTAPCSGPLHLHGCGRECPLMFRDEWLEEVPAPAETLPASLPARACATVRGADEIRSTLDIHQSRGGLVFMPEMYAYAGQRFVVRCRMERVLDGDRYVETKEPIYMLEGLFCGGAAMGADGPCDRGCRLLWHQDWLRLE